MAAFFKALTIFILSLIVVCGYVYDIYMVLNGKVETASDPQKSLMVGQALGNLQGMASIVLAFYFGTTQGSKDKDSTVSEAIGKLPAAPITQTTTTTSTVAPAPVSTATTASTTIQQDSTIPPLAPKP